MHEAAREDRLDRKRSARLTSLSGASAPIWRDVGSDAHSVDESHCSSKRTSAAEEKSALTCTAPNRFEAGAQSFSARHPGIMTDSFRCGRVEKIQLLVFETEISDKLFE